LLPKQRKRATKSAVKPSQHRQSKAARKVGNAVGMKAL